MRKIILILIAMFIGVSVFSQDRTVTRTLSPDQTLYDYDGTSQDTIGSGNTSVEWIFNANKSTSIYFGVKVQFELDDDISATYDKDVVLQGRHFSDDTWNDIEEKANEAFNGSAGDNVTLTYYDTTISDSDSLSVDNSPFYRWYRILIRDGSDGVSGLDAGETVSLDYIYMKFYER